MRVEFEFDQKKVENFGYNIDQIASTLDRIFTEKNLLCVSSNGVFSCAGSNKEMDYSNIWINIKRLVNSNWFLNCASACRFYAGEDKNDYEDVLSRAALLINKK